MVFGLCRSTQDASTPRTIGEEPQKVDLPAEPQASVSPAEEKEVVDGLHLASDTTGDEDKVGATAGEDATGDEQAKTDAVVDAAADAGEDATGDEQAKTDAVV